MLEGECFCGGVRYRIDGALVHARSCHCSRCRRVFGGAASAYAELEAPGSLHWTAGEDGLRHYASQTDWGLLFCGTCGSALCGTHRNQVHGVVLGTVNGDPGVAIEAHIFVGSKAPWDHIGGDAPQYEAGPD